MSSDWNVGKLLNISGGYWAGCAVQAAVRLKLFSVIGENEPNAYEISDAAGTDERATGLLLDALAGLGLLNKQGKVYANGNFAQKFLVESSPAYMGHIVLHHHHILDGWAQLDRAVTTGKRVQCRSYGEEVERESFLMGMFNLASGVAPQVAEKFNLSGRKKLLDLGGGPGTYAIQFCLKNPELEAVIYDRPTTKPFAEETVARFGLSDRIQFVEGDFNLDSIPGAPYDVIWMSHILHSNSYEQCAELLTKAVECVSPGGLIMIHDFILDDNKDGPEFPGLFALNMLVGTDRGRCYSRKEIVQMLHENGCTGIDQQGLKVPNDSSVITAIKKEEVSPDD
jgi:ubiquinone/menaquinone biosynthesis C-methylase UbiE